MIEPSPLPLETFDCENCGGPIAHGATQCAYCKTKYFISARERFLLVTPDEILLLRCPHCYSLVPVVGRCRVCRNILPRITQCDHCHQTVGLTRNCRNCGDLMAEMVRAREDADTRNVFVREIETVSRKRLRQAGIDTPLQFHQRYDGNLEVLVGTRAYPSVKQIQDEAIRKEIEAAVAEWQARR